MIRCGITRRNPHVRTLGGAPTFSLPLADAGAGAVNLAPSFAVGSATATFTRATTATTFDATGASPILVASGTARSYYDPVTHTYGGYLSEVQSTNLLLNSKIDGTNLSTQSVSVTAQAYTLSFYGTGTVTLSGTATGAKVGTGAYPTRSSFTFTPTAGSLTLTVTGTLQYAQLEALSLATSFIPTAGATVTRNKDVLSFASAGNLVTLSPFTIAAEGYIFGNIGNNQNIIGSDVNYAGYVVLQPQAGPPAVSFFDNTGGASATKAIALASMEATHKYAARFDGSNLDVFIDAVQGTTGGRGTAASETSTIYIGGHNGLQQLNGPIKNVRAWSRALSSAEIGAL